MLQKTGFRPITKSMKLTMDMFDQIMVKTGEVTSLSHEIVGFCIEGKNNLEKTIETR